ncbi:hypothetical protein [Sutcliffiella cohnii]|uniref:hypothetical protein n=1 Tax=Sutcliffiella cohnii TaxID=33932 RepID=UPI002E1C7EF5|nr:hypothetical protein [Sutcliffiella cohnii]
MSENINGWEIMKNNIKFKYENLEWKQVNTPYDLITEFDKLEKVCGDTNYLNTCWMDAFNHSVMKLTPLTNDIYLFITHRASVMRDGLENNFWKGINTDFLKESLQPILSAIDLNTIILSLENLFRLLLHLS